jgi:hypothetical protein
MKLGIIIKVINKFYAIAKFENDKIKVRNFIFYEDNYSNLF